MNNTTLNTKILTTREFLRDFKKIKENLVNGKIKEYQVKSNQNVIRVTLKQAKNTAGRIADISKNLPDDLTYKKSNLNWDSLFNDLLK